MKELILLPLLALSGFAAEVSVSIVRPTSNAYSDKQLRVVATVTSAFELATVKATVADRERSLAFTETAYCTGPGSSCDFWHPGWVGDVNLSGLSSGTLLLTIQATDAFGNSGSKSVSFIYDQLPVLNVRLPLDHAVATPLLEIDASCMDDNHCEMEASISGQAIPLAKTVDLSEFDHGAVTLRFRAMDSAGQIATVDRTIYVESSPRFRLESEAPGKILDANSERILFLGAEGIPGIMNRSTGEIEMIPSDSAVYGYLTPEGAIFVRKPGLSVSTSEIVEYPGGSYGNPNSIGSLLARGDYAIWNQGSNLHLRNLRSHETVLVSESAGNNGNDVTSGGQVAFWNREYQIILGGAQISSGPTRNVYPLTDGTRAIWRKMTVTTTVTNFIAFFDGSQEVILSKGRHDQIGQPISEPTPGADYQINSGWAAYTDTGTSGQLQVWLRTPAGEKQQVTYFGTTSRIEALRSNGDVMYWNSSHRYLNNIDLGWGNGHAFLTDNSWKVVLGNSLYSLDTGSKAPIAIEQFGERILIRGYGTLLASNNLLDWTDLGRIDGAISLEMGSAVQFYTLRP